MALATLDALLSEKVAVAQEIPGAVVLVRHGHQVIFFESYGLRQTSPETFPMTRETLFDLASLTKPLSTGLLYMRMWGQGKVRLEQGVEEAFGNLEDPGKQKISVQQFLSNRSGLPSWRPYYQDYEAGNCPVSKEEILEKVLAEPLESLPGECECYSDLGYMLLGWILEKSVGLPLDRIFQREIAGPLRLRNTGYRRIAGSGEASQDTHADMAATEFCPWRNRVIKGEVHDENGYLLGGVAGHAGLFSSAEEVDRIVEEVFKGLDGRSDLFKTDALGVFLNRSSTSSEGTWALGWDTPSEKDSTSGSLFSKNSFGHTGFTGTSLWMDLERRISVILLTNRIHPTRDNAAIRTLRPLVHDTILQEILMSGEKETEST